MIGRFCTQHTRIFVTQLVTKSLFPLPPQLKNDFQVAAILDVISPYII